MSACNSSMKVGISIELPESSFPHLVINYSSCDTINALSTSLFLGTAQQTSLPRPSQCGQNISVIISPILLLLSVKSFESQRRRILMVTAECHSKHVIHATSLQCTGQWQSPLNLSRSLAKVRRLWSFLGSSLLHRHPAKSRVHRPLEAANSTATPWRPTD